MSFCACASIEWVTDSRMIVKPKQRPYIRRRRLCEKCGKRFTTMEVRCNAGRGISTHLALDPETLKVIRKSIRDEIVSEILSALNSKPNQ